MFKKWKSKIKDPSNIKKKELRYTCLSCFKFNLETAG